MSDRTHKGGCSNQRCACNDPSRWPICAEFQEVTRVSVFCARCGWNRAHHEYLQVVATAIVADLEPSNG